MTKSVRVRVRSVAYSCDGEQVFADDGSVRPDVIRYSTDGTFSDDDGSCALTVFEPDELGVGENSVTVISYNRSDKKSLTVTRRGNLSYSMPIDTRFSSAECVMSYLGQTMTVSVWTKKLHNTLRDGTGAILCEYAITAGGVKVETVRLFIEVSDNA